MRGSRSSSRGLGWAAAIAAGLVVLAIRLDAVQQSVPATVRFIEVEPGVKLEVLDWGGTGRPVVLLAGGGRTAHDFESFGPQLATTNRVIAVTRRGMGRSSAPAVGYSAARLGDDVLAVIDSLGLVAPVVAGHSLGGEELSSIGSRYPQKVAGLVYLDGAYDYAFYDTTSGRRTIGKDLIDVNEVRRGLEELVTAARAGAAEDLHRVVARLLDTDLPALTLMLRAIDARTPAVSTNPPTPMMMAPDRPPDKYIYEGLQRHTAVHAPVLALFALRSPGDPAVVQDWLAGRRPEVRSLRSAAPTARVVILPDADHDLFRSNPADVLREMRSFMATLPAR